MGNAWRNAYGLRKNNRYEQRRQLEGGTSLLSISMVETTSKT
jgi:hypothetical protein